MIPNRKQQFRKVVPGALVAGILFEGVTLLLPLYLELNKGINQYGKTFGLFFVLMTFFFFIGLITMVGVEVNSVIYPVPVELPGKDSSTPSPPRSRDLKGSASRGPAASNARGGMAWPATARPATAGAASRRARPSAWPWLPPSSASCSVVEAPAPTEGPVDLSRGG